MATEPEEEEDDCQCFLCQFRRRLAAIAEKLVESGELVKVETRNIETGEVGFTYIPKGIHDKLMQMAHGAKWKIETDQTETFKQN